MYLPGLLLACLLVAQGRAAPTETDRGKGDEGLSPDIQDTNPPGQTETDEKSEPLTPQQKGRLARLNGDFFQLYGATNQHEGNLDAIAGNQLAFRGALIEFLGNEHNMRELAAYLSDVQAAREADSAKATGREKELEEEEAKILGDLRDLVTLAAGKEHEQAQQKAKQFNLESKSYRLEKEETHLKAEEAVTALEIGNLEEEQIKMENNAKRHLARLVAIEEEREQMEKEKEGGATVVAPDSAPPPAPPASTT